MVTRESAYRLFVQLECTGAHHRRSDGCYVGMHLSRDVIGGGGVLVWVRDGGCEWRQMSVWVSFF